MCNDETRRRETFETLYAKDPDPWNFETSAYERDKRAEVLAVLGNRHFNHVLEIGCATGVQTEQIAPRCKSLLAIDVAENALAIARERLAPFPHVTVRQAEVPQDWPDGTYDLILFSEVLYFLSPDEIEFVARQARQSLSPDGICTLVNWTGPSDLPVTGDCAVEIFRAASNWQAASHYCHELYRIDVFTYRKADVPPRLLK